MATEVKRRRGTTIEHSTFTGAVAELTVDLTKDTVVVHDGATQGGFPLLREDFSNVPTTAPFTNISLDTAIFDTAYSADGNEAQGTLYWNEDELTLSLVTNGQTTELGQKVEVHVKNQTGAQINKGEVVYASGTVGSSGRITVAKMIADGTVAAKRVVGVAAENIADGADGKVVHFGKIRQLNTNSFNEGDILWVSTSTAGAFQNTEPVQADGDLALPIAFVVTKSVNNGELFVRINAIDENEYTDYADYVELRSDVIENHLEIESLQDNKVEVGFLFPDGDGQALGTGDNATFNTVTLGEQADTANEAVRADRTVSAGNGLTGGGALTGDVTISMDTPSTLTVSTSNEVTTGSHTHALDLSGRSITLSDDSDGIITFDTNTQNLGADRTYTPTIADHASGQRGVLSIGAQTIYGAKTFNDATTFDTSALLDDTAKIESEAGFVAGFINGEGFRLKKESDLWKLELDDMYIRGALFASEFIVNQISAVNGSDILSPGRGKVEEIDGSDYTVSDPQGGNFASFAVNDIVIVQQVRPHNSAVVKRIIRKVTAVSNNVISLATATSPPISSPSDVGSIEVGDIIVAIGNTSDTDRQANIFRTVTETDSPYVRVNDGIASWADWTGVDKLKVQYGNLDSLTSTYSYSADPGGAYPAFEVSGYGFFSDNAYLTGELRVGDLQSYGDFIEYNSTDGLTIRIGDDDLSTAIAEIRSDLIDIYLADQSTFAGIQFLSGQITLKVGADGKVASARLDATGDESAITLRADFFDFQSDDIVILGDPDQDAGTEAKIALGSNASTITVANTDSGFIASGAGEFKGYIDANNYLRLDSTGLDIKAESFDLSAGNLLIGSGTTSLSGYTPTNATSIITNADFSSTVTFNDNPLGGGSPSGDFGYLDDSVGWEADRTGSSTFSYNASGDYVQFTIDSSNGSNAVKMWQDEGWSDSGTSGTLSSYFGKTLTYTFDIRTAPTANAFQYGELFLRVYAYKNITDNTQASGYDYFQIAETKIISSDLSGFSSTSIDVSAVIRDDYEAIRWSVEFDNFDTTSKAQDQYIFINGVTLGAYDQTKVTLNSNGLSVFNSPIKQFTADSNGFEMVGMDIKAGGLQIPDIGSVQNLKTPDVGYLSVGAVDVGSSFRLYIKDSDGNAKYVTISTS